jgi:hypothetical protein
MIHSNLAKKALLLARVSYIAVHSQEPAAEDMEVKKKAQAGLIPSSLCS